MIRAFGEWERQDALFVALPHKNTDWVPYLDEILQSYREFISAVAKFQQVFVITPNLDDFKRICGDIKNAKHFKIPTDDTWIRDYGAINRENNGKVENLNFTFNAWGGKFASGNDNAVNEKLYQMLGENLINLDLILEGGSIDFNGNGVMLTTEACLLNKNRNSHLDKSELDFKLKEIFGLEKIIWLKHGFIKGDDTDSHVDTLARFVDEKTIAFSICKDKDDEHFDELNALKKELEMTNFNLIELPLPSPIFYENRRLGATYANFIFINDALIVPIYNDKNDKIVLTRLKKACPNREIIGIDARIFIRQNGSLHCSSQNKFVLN